MPRCWAMACRAMPTTSPRQARTAMADTARWRRRCAART
ncbi:hypothetical protein MGSAQ_002570 [marine sediment metagenome]|uniref:Uncharacterized protein n=1 Tax=marine sediment metagenome TaxID=412755 RepID=A0A1B6NR54_9ZZZZ